MQRRNASVMAVHDVHFALALAAENLRSWSYVAQPKASASSSRQPAHLRLANGRGTVHGFLLLRVYEYIRTNQSKRKSGHAPTRSSPHLLLLTVMLIQKPCHRQSPNDRLTSQLPTRVHLHDRRPISGAYKYTVTTTVRSAGLS